MFNKINQWLDQHILPVPVRFLTHRFVILATMCLLIPLLIFAGNTVMVLSINSYLNTMSVAVSSIVLLYATISEIQQKKIAEMQERRAQEDHLHVTEMHDLLQEALANQHEELEELKQMLAAMKGQTYQPKPARELTNLQRLHPRGEARFDQEDTRKRLDDLHNPSRPRDEEHGR